MPSEFECRSQGGRDGLRRKHLPLVGSTRPGLTLTGPRLDSRCERIHATALVLSHPIAVTVCLCAGRRVVFYPASFARRWERGSVRYVEVYAVKQRRMRD